jgi:hypothetical protein
LIFGAARQNQKITIAREERSDTNYGCENDRVVGVQICIFLRVLSRILRANQNDPP